MATVIVITGSPAAGKTRLARQIGERLSLPVIAKDDIKETLFDSLGYADRARSVELGYTAHQLQLRVAGELASRSVPFILESAFFKRAEREIATCLAGVGIVQVWCHANVDLLVERHRRRSTSGHRHPGHGQFDEAIEAEIRRKEGERVYDRLDLPGHLIEIVTDDFDSEDYRAAIDEVLRAYADAG